MPAEPPTPGVDVPAAILWDFDGTLVDSQASWHAAEDRLMREWGGGALSPAQHARLAGNSLVDSARAIMAWTGHDHEDAEHYARVLNDYALEGMAAAGAAFRPGARELLAEARDAGVRCALVSASFTHVLEHIVATMPAGAFDVVIGGDQVEEGKPAPEPYLCAVSRLGLAVRDCVVLEDSVVGTTSAERAGLATIAVPFEVELHEGSRRRVVASLAGLGLAGVGALWRELRDA